MMKLPVARSFVPIPSMGSGQLGVVGVHPWHVAADGPQSKTATLFIASGAQPAALMPVTVVDPPVDPLVSIGSLGVGVTVAVAVGVGVGVAVGVQVAVGVSVGVRVGV